ncbi:MAG: GNAT family N-acetyltransferase [Micropruina sp.]|uniref:GNAT family N-acetyltransferase n=1 Tax=Micropruina sp. TaxID=2737536 RepID=UPI0039E359F9
MTELFSERLLLRPFQAGDVDFLFDLYSRWEVQRYLGRTPRAMTERSEAVGLVERNRAAMGPVHGTWLIAGRDTGERYGALLLKPLPASSEQEPLPLSGETEIGWHLHPDVWGRGIATEAALRVLRHGFDAGLPRVLAVTYPENTASQAVALRIGMRDEGETDAYYNVRCRLFAIDNPG